MFGEAYEISFEVAKNDMQNAYAYSVLGATLLGGGRFVDARRILSKAVALDSKEPLALASFGLLEFYENRLNVSLDYLAEARYYEPDEPDYLFAYAQVAARAERYQEAADAYRKFLLFSKIPDDDRRERIRGLVSFLEYLGLRNDRRPRDQRRSRPRRSSLDRITGFER